MSQLEAEAYSSKKQQPFKLRKDSCRPVALEYNPAGHGAQTDDDVAPAVGSIQ